MRDESVLGFRVHEDTCNPAGGLHGDMMMTVADLVGTMGGGTIVFGLRKFLLDTSTWTFYFVAPAKVGHWVEGRAEVVRQTLFVVVHQHLSSTVGEAEIPARLGDRQDPSADGKLAFGKARVIAPRRLPQPERRLTRRCRSRRASESGACRIGAGANRISETQAELKKLSRQRTAASSTDHAVLPVLRFCRSAGSCTTFAAYHLRGEKYPRRHPGQPQAL